MQKHQSGLFKLLVLSTALISGSAFAAPVLLGTVDKDYGSAAGKDRWSAPYNGGNCDTLNANSITVRDTSTGCQRFGDVFDFSSFAYDSIDHFELTLSYSNTNNLLESWRIRPATSGTVGSSSNTALSRVGGSAVTTTFTISNSNYADVFSTIVNQGTFHLWFQESGLGSHNFSLYSASLGVFGTAPARPQEAPEPGILSLFGLGLLGLSRSIRRRKAL